MTQQTEALRLADALMSDNWDAAETQIERQAAEELRRLHREVTWMKHNMSNVVQVEQSLIAANERLAKVNAQLLKALDWVARRCPEQMLKQPLHAVHQEASYDAGACARAAIEAAHHITGEKK